MNGSDWKKQVLSYFHFTRPERIAILFLLGMILLLKYLPVLLPAGPPPVTETIPDSLMALLSAKVNQDSSARFRKSRNYYQQNPGDGGWGGTGEEPATPDSLKERTYRSYDNRYPYPNYKYKATTPYFRESPGYGNSFPGQAGYRNRNPGKDNSRYREAHSRGQGESFPVGRLFEFDPNTADEAALKELGMPVPVIATLVNFRKKGGRFRQPEDLMRIYGMPESLALRLKGFVRIIAEGAPAGKHKRPGPEFIEINKSGTDEWEKLPGIGPKLAIRVLNYRDKLGGFVAVSQVGEVFGLPDSVFLNILPFLKLDSTELRLIRINEATMEELSRHPYISGYLARTIVQFRSAHGAFRDSSDLGKIHLVTGELGRKILPYLAFQ